MGPACKGHLHPLTSLSNHVRLVFSFDVSLPQTSAWGCCRHKDFYRAEPKSGHRYSSSNCCQKSSLTRTRSWPPSPPTAGAPEPSPLRQHLPRQSDSATSASPPDGRHEVEEKGRSTMLEEDAPRRASLTGKSRRSRSSLRRLDLARREASLYLLVGVASRAGPSSSDARGGHDKLVGSSSLPRSSLPFVLLLCSSIAKGKRRRWGGRRPPPLQPVHGGAGARDGPGAVQCDRTTLK
jgi:hypothetical protein